MNFKCTILCIISVVILIGCGTDQIVSPRQNGEGLQVGAASTKAPGWSSQTGSCKDLTSLQQAIVQKAISMNGMPSGQSVAVPSEWQDDGGGGDDVRHINAIKDFDAWYQKNSVGMSKAPPQSVTDAMRSRFASSTYLAATINLIISQIINRYTGWYVVQKGICLPKTENDMLNFMAYQKQCLEFVRTVVDNCGGKSYDFSATPVSNSSLYRPGMGLYNTNKPNTHAMIIVDLYFDQNGIPQKAKVAEANYPSAGEQTWSNPAGQVAYLRTVKVGREVSLTQSGYIVVDFKR